MSILGVLAKVATIAGAVERAGAAVAGAIRRWRRMPRPKALDREKPMPWTHATTDHVEEQIDSATSHKVTQLRPPPLKPRTRYDE